MNKTMRKKSIKALLKSIELYSNRRQMSIALGISSTNIPKWVAGLQDVPLRHSFKISELIEGKVEVHELRPDFKDDLFNYMERMKGEKETNIE